MHEAYGPLLGIHTPKLGKITSFEAYTPPLQ